MTIKKGTYYTVVVVKHYYCVVNIADNKTVYKTQNKTAALDKLAVYDAKTPSIYDELFAAKPCINTNY